MGRLNIRMQQKKIIVTGMVQGVGFRPAVAELAETCGICGYVKNMGGVVEILALGEDEAMEKFFHRLNTLPGQINKIEVVDIGSSVNEIYTIEDHTQSSESSNIIQMYISKNKFEIVKSSNEREKTRLLPVDFPTCERCKKELYDKKNRRYRYPFISCTACGPRYSIQKLVPYDRESITMGDFIMCAECGNEYKEKGNIRRHAQTIACHNCGPMLRLVLSKEQLSNVKESELLTKQTVSENIVAFSHDTEWILSYAINALKQEKIVAMKDIGGFHFAFSPMSSEAAKRLRTFKNRDKKPFAVMFPDMKAVKEYCEVSEKEEELLTGIARPIVLLKKKKDFVPEICGDSDRIGVLLPCNPLQILLIEETGPLVMTSGNRGGEPIITTDEKMQKFLEMGCPDLMLTHDREILTPLDDSIYQVNGDYVQLIRRARGLVPEPIELRDSLTIPVFAAGGDLKASFAYGQGKMVYLSQYFGDLSDVRCIQKWESEKKRLNELLQIEPKRTIGDLHPAYVSAKNIEQKVQHHAAHVASVIAEWHLKGTVLGIACDGTGFGCDGTIWGSEFLLYKEDKINEENRIMKEHMPQMQRVGHFSSVKLLGGDASAKEADKTLFSYMMEAVERGDLTEEQLEAVLNRKESPEDRTEGILNLQKMAWKQNINTAYSSSLGRLFDAASALLDICYYNSYEGECAILLEKAAHCGQDLLTDKEKKAKCMDNTIEKDIFELRIPVYKEKDVWIADGVKFLVDLWKLQKKYSQESNVKEILAYGFHHAVAMAIVTMAELICKEYNESVGQLEEGLLSENLCEQIALSGGSFINRILLTEVSDCLKEKGKKVYINQKVPCGDGGIALGQVFLANK